MTRFGTAAFRHEGSVTALAASPRDRLVAASALFANDTAVWEVDTGKRVLSISEPASTLSWSPDGTQLAVAQAFLAVWSLPFRVQKKIDGGRSPAVLLAKDRVAHATDAPGRVVVTGGDGPTFTLEPRGTVPITDLAFDPPSARLAIVAKRDDASWVHVVRADDPGSLTEIEALRGAQRVCFVPGTGVLVAAGEGGLHAWDLDAQKMVWRAPGARPEGLSVSPNGALVATCDAMGPALVHDAADGTRHATIELLGLDGPVALVDDATLATAWGGTVAFFDPQSGARRHDRGDGHEGAVQRLALSADGRVLATASLDLTARLWDVETGRTRARVTHDNAVSDVAISADGAALVTGSADDTVRLWNGDGEPLERFAQPGDVFEKRCVAISPSGRWLAHQAGARLVVRERGGEEWSVGLDRAPLRIAFLSEDELAVLTKSALWIRSRDGGVVATRRGASHEPILAVAPGGDLLAVVDDDALIALRRSDRGLAETFRRRVSLATAAAISREGLVAVVGIDGLEVFDLVSNEEVGTASLPWTANDVVFLPDGRAVAIAYRNGVAETRGVARSRRLRAADREKEMDSLDAALRDTIRRLAARWTPAGYRGGSVGEHLDDDGRGAHLVEGDAPRVHVRLTRDADAIRVEVRGGIEPDAVAPPSGTLIRLAAWVRAKLAPGRADADARGMGTRTRELVGPELASRARYVRTGPAAVLSVALDDVPAPEQLDAWARAVQARLRVSSDPE